MDILKNLTVGFLFVLGMVIVALGITPAHKQVPCDYEKRIEVDKAEKVPQAITNAIQDVESRNFIVVNLQVRECFIDRTFEVRAKGLDKGSLLNLD